MTSVLTSEISLYELVAGSTSVPLAMQVSPVTFKAIMSSLIDLLIEQNEPTSVWVKLPKGGAWQTEFDRYLTRVTSTQQVFCFRNQRDEIPEETSGLEPLSQSQISETIVLPPDSHLRKEYFLLIRSEQFCALLVGQRARTVLRDGNASTTIDDEATEKKQALMAFLIVDPEIVQQAIAYLQPFIPGSEVQSELNAFSPTFANQLLAKHLQRQEDLWQRASTHRRQAELANLLQLQNEELLSTIRLKDEFLHKVGQELRTPLTNMKTALTLLNSPTVKPTQKQRYMDLLSRECDRQSSLITSLLDLVSLDQMVEQTTIQALSLADVVPGVVSTYQPLAEEKGVRLAYTVPENLPAIGCLVKADCD
mgnify:FL=1